MPRIRKILEDKVAKPAPATKKIAKFKNIAAKKTENPVNTIQGKTENPVDLKLPKPTKRKYIRKEKDFISFLKQEIENRDFSLEQIEKIREILENIKEKEIQKLEENIRKNQERLEALKKLKG
ncbi:MAG TPA: hypothetical protein PK252_03690 [Bacteroidales bacterium]|nr:hypothetical protein [Bacteroidales bacterium]